MNRTRITAIVGSIIWALASCSPSLPQSGQVDVTIEACGNLCDDAHQCHSSEGELEQ